MKRRGDLRKGPETWTVQITPEQRRYHTGNGIRKKKPQPEQSTQLRHAAVEDKCEDQGEAKHNRHLYHHEQQHATNTFPETAILECLEVGLATYENCASNKPVSIKTDPQCIPYTTHQKNNQQ